MARRIGLSGQSSIASLISSELALSSGAYIAEAFVGSALNLLGISARRRYERLCWPQAKIRTKNVTLCSSLDCLGETTQRNRNSPPTVSPCQTM